MRVLFDLNGTLLDPGAMTAGWPGAPRGSALQVLDDAVAQAMVDTIGGEFRPFPEYIAAALSRQAAVHRVGADEVEAAVEASKSLPAFPDAAIALKALREAGFPPSVVTNSAADAARKSLAAAGLDGLVDEVVGADAVQAYKPDRRVYEAALRALGTAPEETWLVAAHWWDVAGAKRAGLRTAWVGRDDVVLLPTTPPPDVQATDLLVAAARIVDAAG